MNDLAQTSRSVPLQASVVNGMARKVARASAPCRRNSMKRMVAMNDLEQTSRSAPLLASVVGGMARKVARASAPCQKDISNALQAFSSRTSLLTSERVHKKCSQV